MSLRTSFAQLVNSLVEFCPAVEGKRIAGAMLANAFTLQGRNQPGCEA